MEELGINAGLQDRVIQIYNGCVYMDFDRELMERQGHGAYEYISLDKVSGWMGDSVGWTSDDVAGWGGCFYQ